MGLLGRFLGASYGVPRNLVFATLVPAPQNTHNSLFSKEKYAFSGFSLAAVGNVWNPTNVGSPGEMRSPGLHET
jgi:hypothetical protein